MSIAFLFPGQGSQSTGMLNALMRHQAILETLDEASDVLGYDVRELDGETALESTVSVQLALLTAGVGTARAFSAEGLIPDAVAGISVGAFAAAVQCGVLNFADAIRLVRLRAESMAALYPTGYGLSAIIGLSEEKVVSLLEQSYTENDPVYLANINSRSQLVIAGSDAGMQKVLVAALQQGARKVRRLPVSVPSHCPLLQSVVTTLRSMLQNMILGAPTAAAYIGNVRGRPLRSSADIAEDIFSNIAHPVRWTDTTSVLEELGCHVFLEMSPGHVLRDLARQDNPEVKAIAVENTEISSTLSAFVRSSDW